MKIVAVPALREEHEGEIAKCACHERTPNGLGQLVKRNVFLESPRAREVDVDDPADADVNTDRSGADEVDVGGRDGELQAETGGEGDGCADEAAEYADLRLARQHDHDGDEVTVDLDADGQDDGGGARGDAEIDGETDADAAEDEDVDLVVLNAGADGHGAGERIDDPVAGRVHGADADHEADGEADDVE